MCGRGHTDSTGNVTIYYQAIERFATVGDTYRQATTLLNLWQQLTVPFRDDHLQQAWALATQYAYVTLQGKLAGAQADHAWFVDQNPEVIGQWYARTYQQLDATDNQDRERFEAHLASTLGYRDSDIFCTSDGSVLFPKILTFLTHWEKVVTAIGNS